MVYPEVSKEDKEKVEGKPDRHPPMFSRIFGGDNLTIFMEKFFRKARVQLMRAENWLSGIANRLRERRSRREAAREEQGENSNPPSSQDHKGPPATFIAFNKEDSKFDENYWVEVLKQEPKNVYPCKKLGEIYTAREDFREARAILKYAVKLEPNDEEAKGMLEGLKGKRTRRKTQDA